jgi:hypothetical protein
LRRPRGTRAALVQTLRRPGPRLPTVSSKWMLLLNDTYQLQQGAPSEIVSCIHPNQPWEFCKPARRKLQPCPRRPDQ